MPIGLWQLEWLNLNSQRRYPLAEEGDGVDRSGSFVIPDDFLLELDLAVHAGMDVAPGNFFVLNVGAYATGYSVVVGYQPADGGPPVPVATALIARQLHTRNKVYALGGVAPFDDATGKLVIGKLDSIDLQPPGFWLFDVDHSRLDPDCIRPIIRGVSSITAVNAGEADVPLYGDVLLEAGANVRLDVSNVPGLDPVITVNAINGAGTVADCTCVGQDAPRPPIRTINGIGPTQAGDFSLLGDDCLQLTAAANGLQLGDACSRPCCGCAELEAITRDLETLDGQARAVEQFLTELDAAVTTMGVTVLGAKLSDRGCP